MGEAHPRYLKEEPFPPSHHFKVLIPTMFSVKLLSRIIIRPALFGGVAGWLPFVEPSTYLPSSWLHVKSGAENGKCLVNHAVHWLGLALWIPKGHHRTTTVVLDRWLDVRLWSIFEIDSYCFSCLAPLISITRRPLFPNSNIHKGPPRLHAEGLALVGTTSVCTGQTSPRSKRRKSLNSDQEDELDII